MKSSTSFFQLPSPSLGLLFFLLILSRLSYNEFSIKIDKNKILVRSKKVLRSEDLKYFRNQLEKNVGRNRTKRKADHRRDG